MKIISWNINGVNAWSQKEGVFEFLEEENPDIFCVQELKTSPEKLPNILENFPFHYYHFAEKKGYSGTGIFAKQKPLSCSFGIEKIDNEGRVITLEFEKFFLVNVYTPNSKNDLSRLNYRKNIWDKIFLEHIEKLQLRKNVIVCGDLNVLGSDIDLQNFEVYLKDEQFKYKILEERVGLIKMFDSGFVDSYRFLNPNKIEYSWFAPRLLQLPSTRLDYFLVHKNLIDKVLYSKIMKENGSDHLPISLSIDLNLTRTHRDKIEKIFFPEVVNIQASLF